MKPCDPRDPSVLVETHGCPVRPRQNGPAHDVDVVHVRVGSELAKLANEWGFSIELLVQVAVQYGVKNLPNAMAAHAATALLQIRAE